MATYEELRGLYNDTPLRNRVAVAAVVAAEALLAGTPTANDRAWALDVMANSELWGEKIFKIVLAKNKDASMAAIQGATDAAIQSNVDAVVPQVVTAFAGG